MDAQPDRSEVLGAERPSSRLLTYYILSSLLWGPLLVAILPYRLARYRTLRYRFDHEGVSMTWGALFRREIHLTYSRIQDIHLTSGILERYLGLARIQVETASGKTGAEMTIEGLEHFEEVRDFLYSKMRGLRRDSPDQPTQRIVAADSGRAALSTDADLVAMLGELATTLRELRHLLETGHGAQAGDATDV
jgi:membrane protein YdbS with pleckstrin-like domain